jgi:two-component system sensor histidine kinase YesM
VGNEVNLQRLLSFKSPIVKLGLGSIRAKFILSFIVLSIIPMVVLAIFSYHTYLGILQSNVEAYSGEVIDRVERNLQIYISDLERILESRSDYYNVQFIKLSQAGDVEGNRKYTFRLWENSGPVSATVRNILLFGKRRSTSGTICTFKKLVTVINTITFWRLIPKF